MFYDPLKGLCGFPRITIGQNKIRATNDLVASFPSDGLLSGKIEKAIIAWPTCALLLSPLPASPRRTCQNPSPFVSENGRESHKNLKKNLQPVVKIWWVIVLGNLALKLLVPYLRTADGAIQRLSDRIYEAWSDSLEPYVHTQNLVGWPEPRVFWAKETAPSLGIAPLNAVSPD